MGDNQTAVFEFGSVAAIMDSWCFPGAVLDPRFTRVDIGAETGSLALYYKGIGVTIAHTDAPAAVQTALNDATTGWGQIGVVVSVGGAAGIWTITFTSWPDLSVDRVAIDGSGLSSSGATIVRSSRDIWLAAGTIKTISLTGAGTAAADPRVRIYNTADLRGRPIHSTRVGVTVGRARSKGYPMIEPHVAAYLMPEMFEVQAAQAGTLTPSLTQQNPEHDSHLSEEQLDLDVRCPYGMAIHLTTTANQAATIRATVVYCPEGAGNLRLKNSLIAERNGATRTTPVLN